MRLSFYHWYGGKGRLVEKIAALIPEHEAYYEVFMGSAALLLNHPRSHLEVLCDLDPELVFLMEMMADRKKGRLLVEKLCGLWYGKSFFEEALEHQKNRYRGLDDIEKAAMIFTIITQSFNGLRKNFARGKDTRCYRANIQVQMPQIYERLAGVRVRNMDGIEMIERVKWDKEAFVFADPPYRAELRGKGADKAYKCEMPYKEQVKLLKTIRDARCKIMLCGYRGPDGDDLYDKYLRGYGWKCYLLGELVKSCQRKKGETKDRAQEYVWVNYSLPNVAQYYISMREYGDL